MDRRGFLGAILAAAVAPAIVRADSLMRIIPRDTRVLQQFVVTSLSMDELRLSMSEYRHRILEPWAAEMARRLDDEVERVIVGGGHGLLLGDVVTIEGVWQA